MPKATTAEIEERIVGYLQRHHREGAMYTSDLAHGAKETTDRVRRVLGGMEKRNIVRRVATGNPTTWILSDPSPAARS